MTKGNEGIINHVLNLLSFEPIYIKKSPKTIKRFRALYFDEDQGYWAEAVAAPPCFFASKSSSMFTVSEINLSPSVLSLP